MPQDLNYKESKKKKKKDGTQSRENDYQRLEGKGNRESFKGYTLSYIRN